MRSWMGVCGDVSLAVCEGGVVKTGGAVGCRASGGVGRVNVVVGRAARRFVHVFAGCVVGGRAGR